MAKIALRVVKIIFDGSCITEVMATSLVEILESPNFGNVTKSTT